MISFGTMVTQDAPVTSDGGSDLKEGTMEGVLLGVEGCQRQDRPAGVKSRRVQVPSRKDSESASEGRELKDLSADVLVQVFSYLPQLELFEVMCVSKAWEKAVLEGTVLWTKLKVYRKWDMGGRGGRGGDRAGNQLILRVMSLARGWGFRGAKGPMKNHIMSVTGIDRPHLQILQLPDRSITSPALSLLLSKCHQLEKLSVDGEPTGTDPIHIHHLKLHSLDMSCEKSRSLTVHCPSLTYLSTAGNSTTVPNDSLRADALLPSLHCPLLTCLHTNGRHSSPIFLESMVAHAPNILRLKIDLNGENPFGALTHFKNLIAVHLRNCGGISRHAFDQWPQLSNLSLHFKRGEEELHVHHQGLKYLSIEHCRLPLEARLNFSSLECLSFHLHDIPTKRLGELHITCPRLRTLDIERIFPHHREEGKGSFNFFHETLEELTLVGLPYLEMHIGCPKLTVLIIYGEMVLAMPRLTAECPSLKKLGIHGCNKVPTQDVVR